MGIARAEVADPFGIHGGEVVNIASRMEQAARTHRIGCAISDEMAAAFDPAFDGFEPLPDECVKRLPGPVRICEYRPRVVVAEPISCAQAVRRGAGA
ncbi:MAG TPA: hypothetical protein VH414_18365 [Lichenihabitans sp.]|jgi:class 3 adenylate cyclase|nr:hypothetical protein [Lichenihabitans sp.]